MKRSYVSKRRKRGAQPGNLNADGLGKFAGQEKSEEEAEPEVFSVDIEGLKNLMSRDDERQDDEVSRGMQGLESEIQMMRIAMRKLMRMARQATTLGEVMKATQILSLAGERLASMLLAQSRLEKEGKSEFNREVNLAIRQALKELEEGV
jgi:hypothetical protein